MGRGALWRDNQLSTFAHMHTSSSHSTTSPWSPIPYPHCVPTAAGPVTLGPRVRRAVAALLVPATHLHPPCAPRCDGDEGPPPWRAAPCGGVCDGERRDRCVRAGPPLVPPPAFGDVGARPLPAGDPCSRGHPADHVAVPHTSGVAACPVAPLSLAHPLLDAGEGTPHRLLRAPEDDDEHRA